MTELPMHKIGLSSEEQTTFVIALQTIRKKVRWKSGKDIIHLAKRRRMKHLTASALLGDYEQIIFSIVRNGQNIVYLYDFNGMYYYAVRGFVEDNEWLVLFGLGGVMETAFPPENMDEYLESRGFILLGRVKEVLEWTIEVNN